MAVHLSPLCEPRDESTLLDMNQELRSQLAQCKQELRDVKENLLVSEATAYVLANHLQKTNNEGCKEITELVLGEKLQCEVKKLADRLPEQLKKCDIVMQSQKQQVLNLTQKLQDGWGLSCLLHQSIHLLLTQEDLDSSPGQVLRQKMAEMQGLVEHLISKLSPENTEEEQEAEETVDSSKISMNMEEKKREVLSEEDTVNLTSNLEISSSYEQSNIQGEMTTEENTTVLSGKDTYPEQRDEEQFYASPPLSIVDKSLLSDEEDNEDTKYRLDEIYLMPSDNYDLSVPYKPSIYSREACYEREGFSTVNRQAVAFEVTVSALNPDPRLEIADSFASKSTCELSEEIIAFGSMKWKEMKRKFRFSTRRLACRFPGLQT